MAEISWRPVRVRLRDLKPWERNPRRMSKRAAERLLRSWREFGQVQTIAVGPGGEVYDGHQRLSALRAVYGEDYEVLALQASRPLTEAERERLVLMLHAGASGEWDWDALANWEPEVLLEGGLDEEMLEALNRDAAALSELLASLAAEGAEELPDDPGAQIDKADELREKWGAEPGQLWRIPSKSVPGGEHRIICGDATDPDVVARVMGGEKAAMVFTDPPWNVAIGLDSNPRHRQREGLANDNLSPEDFELFLSSFVRVMTPYLEGDLYCVLGASEWPRLDWVLRRHGYHWSATIIWVKNQFVLGRSKYHRRYEPIWYGWPESRQSSFVGGRDQDDVWEIERPRVSEEHPTMKPVALVERAIGNSSMEGDVVFDPFLGSGTTIVACERLGRLGRGVEIEPKYVAVALERLAEMGLEPELAGERT